MIRYSCQNRQSLIPWSIKYYQTLSDVVGPIGTLGRPVRPLRKG